MEFNSELLVIILIIFCVAAILFCLFVIFMSNSNKINLDNKKQENNSNLSFDNNIDANNVTKKKSISRFSVYAGLFSKDEKIINVATFKAFGLYILSCISCIIVLLILPLIEGNIHGSLEDYYTEFFPIMLIVSLFIIVFMVNIVLHGYGMIVTNKKVVLRYGIFSDNTAEINLKKIEGCDIKRGLFALLFGYATIIVKGTGMSLVPIRYVGNFRELRQSIYQAVENIN